tara:strand:+ start:189 stop:503 length:315 start_codon:yes stop_codon:yes gene_type:complete
MKGNVMSEYGWMALELGEPNHVVMGPSDLSPDIEERLRNGEGEKFLLMCGDNKIMAKGRIITLDDDPASMTEVGFAPLDDYGEPSLGAAGIKYRSGKTGKYEYL